MDTNTLGTWGLSSVRMKGRLEASRSYPCSSEHAAGGAAIASKASLASCPNDAVVAEHLT